MKGLHLKRNILLNPGPATTTDTVKLAMLVADICPRETEFVHLLSEICEGLLRVVNADPSYTCVLFTGSGTAVMDAVINSVMPHGEKLLIINNGAYGERMVKIAEAYGIDYVEHCSDWAAPLNLQVIEEILAADQTVSHLAFVHHETTTGMLNPLTPLYGLALKHGKKVIVDAISSYAGIPINLQDCPVDYLLATSNKCIQGMAGLSFVICKKNALEDLANITPRSFYLNLSRQYRYWVDHKELPYTPAVQVAYALRQALVEYFEEGTEGRHNRYFENWQSLTAGLHKLGLKFLLPESLQSHILTTVYYPEHPRFDFIRLHDLLYERGFTIYPGKVGKLNTFRIANMGAINKDDIQDFLLNLSEVFVAMGIMDMTLAPSQ